MSEKLMIIILARKGSKRLKNKNILLFHNKPLVCWTIEQAIRFKKITDRIIISTDNLEILKYKKNYKDVDFIKRPTYLSESNSTSVDAIKHILKKTKFKGNLILLQPTSPLRKDKDISKVITLIKKGFSPIMSVCKHSHNTSLIFENKNYEKCRPVVKKKKRVCYPNGAIYAAHSNWISCNTSFYTQDTYTYFMKEQDSIDIDFKYQFIMAEALFKK